MKIQTSNLSDKIKNIWNRKYDRIIIGALLIAAVALAIIGGYVSYANLLAPDKLESPQIIKRELFINEKEVEQALSIIETRRHSQSNIDLTDLSDPFPED